MLSRLILLLTFFYSTFAFSQSDYTNGYIITNDFDTLAGKISDKVSPGAGKVKFVEANGKKKTYYPRQIKGFVINDTLFYQSILQVENANADAYQVFALVVTNGKLILLATKNKTGKVLQSKEDRSEGGGYNYYVQDSLTAKITRLSKISYRDQLAGIVENNIDLRREVQNKVYKYDEIPEVIGKYNAWITSQKK